MSFPRPTSGSGARSFVRTVPARVAVVLLFAVGCANSVHASGDVSKAVRVIEKGDIGDIDVLVRELREGSDPLDALTIGLESFEILDERRDKAMAVRDAQGSKLYRYYVANYKSDGSSKSSWKSPKANEAYQAMKDESRELNAEVRDLTRLLTVFRGLVHDTGESMIESGRREDVLREVRDRFDARRSSGATAVFLLGLPKGLTELAPDLARVALESDERAPRVAALRYFVDTPHADVLDAALECTSVEDSYVRRAAHEALAALASAEAIDLLLDRLEAETGLPEREIGDGLRWVFGVDFHENVALWRDHWSKERDGWDGEKRGKRLSRAAEAETWRYHGLRLHSKRVVFVIDISASMERGVGYRPLPAGFANPTVNEGRRKMDIARDELLRAIDSLADDASFNLIVYHTKIKTLFPRMMPADKSNRDKARKWVLRLEPWGNTNLSEPLLSALQMTEAGARPDDMEIADTILFLSDGKSTCGPIKYEEDLLAEVERSNPFGQVTVHTISLGFEDNEEFMKSLADRNGGQHVRIED